MIHKVKNSVDFVTFVKVAAPRSFSRFFFSFFFVRVVVSQMVNSLMHQIAVETGSPQSSLCDDVTLMCVREMIKVEQVTGTAC